jgi:hypothetical protein
MEPDGKFGELLDVRAPEVLKLIPQMKPLEWLQ